MIKVLFIGDIVGRIGRDCVREILPKLKQEHHPDLTIANGENLAHGRGFTENTVEEMIRAGIDFFTSGNHIFNNRAALPLLNDRKFPMIRPANFPPGNPGRGYHLFETAKFYKVAIVNLHGRVFMKENYDCPFRKMDELLPEIKADQPQAIIVDIHAEATSEKAAIAHYLDGKVSAVVGTHTHIPTADAHILDEGTAFLTDAGMVGAIDSIIGAEKEGIIESFISQAPFKYDIAEGPCTFNSVLFEIDETTGKAENITQIIEKFDNL